MTTRPIALADRPPRYFAVALSGAATVSVCLKAASFSTAREEIAAANTSAWWDAGRTDIEDALDLCFDGAEEQPMAMLARAGAERVGTVDGWDIYVV